MPEIRIACTAAEVVPLGRLRIIQDNLKALPNENYEKLRDEIAAHGFSYALHVWRIPDAKGPDLGILDGTQRFRAVRRMVDKESYVVDGLPVVYVEAATEREAVLKCLGGAGMYGVPQDEGLAALMKKHGITPAEIPNISLPGIELPSFALKHFPDAVPGSGGGDGKDDEVPEPPKVAKSKRGELYILGEHRLLCGDATSKEDVERLMGAERAVLWSSDPPYGINHVSTSQEKGQGSGYSEIANDDLQFDELKAFLEKVIRNCIEVGLSERFAFYMWHAMKMQSYAAAAAAAAAGVLFHRQIIWVKPSLVFGRGQYHWRHELCLMGWLQGKECPFYGERNQTTVWELGRENDKIHPTQKPTAVTEIPIANHTKKGDIVLDPFLGSGSSLIACEKTGRRGFGLEVNPVYADVILTRWSTFTGKDPVREDGTPWSKIKATPCSS